MNRNSSRSFAVRSAIIGEAVTPFQTSSFQKSASAVGRCFVNAAISAAVTSNPEWIAELQADAALERHDMAEREQRRFAGEVDPLEMWRRLQPPPPKPSPATPPPAPVRRKEKAPMIDTLLEGLADETGRNVAEAISGLRQELGPRLGAVEAENADLKAPPRSNGLARERDAH